MSKNKTVRHRKIVAALKRAERVGKIDCWRRVPYDELQPGEYAVTFEILTKVGGKTVRLSEVKAEIFVDTDLSA
jgi:hypothetical protein